MCTTPASDGKVQVLLCIKQRICQCKKNPYRDDFEIEIVTAEGKTEGKTSGVVMLTTRELEVQRKFHTIFHHTFIILRCLGLLDLEILARNEQSKSGRCTAFFLSARLFWNSFSSSCPAPTDPWLPFWLSEFGVFVFFGQDIILQRYLPFSRRCDIGPHQNVPNT